MKERIFKTTEAARLCHCANRTMVRWFNLGEVRGYTIPGRGDRRILGSSLLHFMKSRGMPIPPEMAASNRLLLIGLEPLLADRVSAAIREESADWQVECASTLFEAGLIFDTVHPSHVVICRSIGGHETACLVDRLTVDVNRPRLWVVVGEDFLAQDDTSLASLVDIVRRPFDPLALAVQLIATSSEE